MKTFTEYLKEGEKRWKQTSMSPVEAIKQYGKDNVKVKKAALRNGDDMVEVYVESVENVSEGFKIRDKSRGYGVSDKTYKTRAEAKDAAVMKSASSGGDWEVIEEKVATNEGTKGCADCEYMKDETDGEIDTCDECAAEKREKTNEAGGYYTKPVYDMIEQHGIEKVMHELLTALDGDVIQDALSRMNTENESYSPGDENEDGMVSNCCGAPIMNVYQGHGRCSDCKEMASAERVEESTEICEDCGCTIGQPESGCECNNNAHTHAHEELDYLRKLAGI